MIRFWRKYLQSESGLEPISWLAIGAATLMTLIAIGQRVGLGDTMKREISDCVAQVKAAQGGIQTALTLKPNEPVPFNDPNAVVISRCKDLADILANDPLVKSQARSLQGLVEPTLQKIGQCAMYPEELVAQGIAGRPYQTQVRAHLPLSGDGVTAQATISGGGVAGAVPLVRGGQGWVASLVVPGANSENVADGAKSSIAVPAAANAIGTDDKPITPRPDGTCPFGLERVGNACRISCTVTAAEAVTWKVPPKIEASLNISSSDATTATLTWTTKNSEQRKLSGAGVPGSPAIVGESASFPVKRTAKDEIYTLTATATNAETVTRTVTVGPKTGPSTYALTLNPVGVVAADSATVSGQVSPAPPAGTRVGIEVEGGASQVVTVNGGTFSGLVQLPQANRAATGDMLLQNSSANITACGGAVRPITLTNKKTDATTTVRAAVLPPPGTDVTPDTLQSNLATIKIEHAVRVISVSVSWSGDCPGPPDSPPAGQIIKAGQTADLGDVTCGIPCPGHGTKCVSTVAQVSVSTTVGSFFTNANWVIDIP